MRCYILALFFLQVGTIQLGQFRIGRRWQENDDTQSPASLYDGFATPYFDRDFSFEFMLIVPKYKLMFCFVPKNGCSAFNALVNDINGIEEPERGPWFVSNARSFGWNQSMIE